MTVAFTLALALFLVLMAVADLLPSESELRAGVVAPLG
jgi:hypothetical protein